MVKGRRKSELTLQKEMTLFGDDIYVSADVGDCLVACKSTTVMTVLKQDLLSHFVGTDEGEVTEYFGCEII